jgi:predicted PurR-regulated permease PerM
MKYTNLPILLTAAAVTGIIGLAIFAGPLLDSLLIAGLVAYLLDPPVRWLQKRFRLSRGVAAGLVYFMALLLLGGLIAGFGTLAWGQLPRLSRELSDALVEMRGWLARPFVLLGFRLDPQQLLENLQRSGGNTIASLPLGSVGVLATIGNNLLWSTLVLVSLYYFLKDGPKIKPWLISWLPPQHQPAARRLLDEIDLVWSVFLRMQLLIFAILAALFIASTLLIIWLFRAGWLPLSPLGLVILFALVYTAIQQVDNLWLRPQLLGRSLQLHPGVVFVGLIAALALSGVLGALIVVPLMATVKIVAAYLHARWLGLPPWPDPPGSSPPPAAPDAPAALP